MKRKMGNVKNAALIGVVTAAVAAGYSQWESSGKVIVKPYFDIGGVATVCDGHTGNVDMSRIYTPQECMSFRNEDILKHQAGIAECITVPISQNEMDAYTLFASNIGVNAYCTSSVLKVLNKGDNVGACYLMSQYTYVKKQYVQGLMNRRKFEISMCLKGVS